METILAIAAFGATYSVYWIVAIIDPDCPTTLSSILNSVGKILAFSYLILNAFMNFIILAYLAYLKIQLNLSKEEIIQMMVEKHKKKIFIFAVISLLMALLVFSLAMVEQSMDNDHFIKVHSLFLCVATIHYFYQVCKWQRYFEQNIKTQAIFLILILILIGFLVILDFYFTSKANRQYRNEISANIILLLEMLYICMFLNQEKQTGRLILKLSQTLYLIRYYWQMIVSVMHPKSKRFHKMDQILMIILLVMIIIINLKDLIVAYIILKRKWLQNNLNQQRLFRKDRIQQYLSKQATKLNVSQIHLEQRIQSSCVICMNALESGQMKLPDCKHQFHIECISEWLSHRLKCPLCNVSIVIA